MARYTYGTEGFARDEHVVDGVRSVVYSAGDGPPVVYFHGGGTFHGFQWARDWADRFHVILPYHPGFGESGEAPDVASMEDFVAHYAALFAALGLERIGLSGTSLGGRLAAQFALAHPDLVRRLVVAAPGGLIAADCPLPDFASIPPQDFPYLLSADRTLIDRYWPKDAGPDFLTDRGREGQASARAMGDPVAAERDLRRRLPGLAVPTLVLWGGKDRILLPGLASHWAAIIPGARAEVIAEAGHLLFDESVWARQIAAEFLAG
jgi:pimeloyl-ACP methyl ester carboxylesterase